MNLDRLRWLRTEIRFRLTGKKYNIALSPEAQRQLDEMPEAKRQMVLETIERLRRNPYAAKRIFEEDDQESETTRDKELEEKIRKLKQTKTVIIEVSGGVVQDVSNLPEGWMYEVIDYDNEEEG